MSPDPQHPDALRRPTLESVRGAAVGSALGEFGSPHDPLAFAGRRAQQHGRGRAGPQPRNQGRRRPGHDRRRGKHAPDAGRGRRQGGGRSWRNRSARATGDRTCSTARARRLASTARKADQKSGNQIQSEVGTRSPFSLRWEPTADWTTKQEQDTTAGIRRKSTAVDMARLPLHGQVDVTLEFRAKIRQSRSSPTSASPCSAVGWRIRARRLLICRSLVRAQVGEPLLRSDRTGRDPAPRASGGGCRTPRPTRASWRCCPGRPRDDARAPVRVPGR